MFKTILAAFLFVGLVACNGNCPTPKECPDPIACDSCCEPCPECEPCDACCPPIETLECPEGYTLNKSELKWECEKDVVVTEADPKDYVSLSNADNIINEVEVDSRTDIYLGYWTSMKNIQNCATKCGGPMTEAVLGMTKDELHVLAAKGESLINQWERKFKKNLTTENRRVAEGDTRFEGKSNLKKANWRAFKEGIREHNETIRSLNQLALADTAANCNFDNIQGWCGCRLGEIPPR